MGPDCVKTPNHLENRDPKSIASYEIVDCGASGEVALTSIIWKNEFLHSLGR